MPEEVESLDLVLARIEAHFEDVIELLEEMK